MAIPQCVQSLNSILISVAKRPKTASTLKRARTYDPCASFAPTVC
jgi:hypothetical protein